MLLLQEQLSAQSQVLITGIINLLRDCPPQVATIRKEIFNSCRHLFGSELRNKFIPHLSHFFDQQLMIGNGYTANETLRFVARAL